MFRLEYNGIDIWVVISIGRWMGSLVFRFLRPTGPSGHFSVLDNVDRLNSYNYIPVMSTLLIVI